MDNGNAKLLFGELQGPRKIRLTCRGGSLIALVTVILASFISLAIYLYVDDSRAIQKSKDLTANGRVANASSVSVSGLNGFSIVYSFSFNGESYSGRAHIPRNRENEISTFKTSPFPILFLPDDPAVNQPKSFDLVRSHAWHVYGLLLFIPSCLCLVRARDIFRDLQLARKGITSIGTVVGRTTSKTGNIVLSYEFRDSEDILNEGAGYHPVAVKNGEKICVLYLPQKTGENRPYPLFYFQVRTSGG